MIVILDIPIIDHDEIAQNSSIIEHSWHLTVISLFKEEDAVSPLGAGCAESYSGG